MTPRPDLPSLDRRVEIALLSVIVLAATFLRLWQLDTIPPGFTHDEAGHGQDAIAILGGARPLYETIGYGREPLYDYVVAVAMAVSGRANYVVLRVVSALSGLLSITIAYLWIRRAFGVWEALLACAWLAGSFWAVSVSRQALRSGLLPALLAAAVYAWWRGAFDADERPRATWPWFATSGVFVAATLWTYMAARVTWALFPAFAAYLLVTDRARFKRRWPGMLLALGLAAILAAPMFVWLQQHPSAEQRFAQLGEPLQALASGDVREIWVNGLEALGMFTLRADDLWMYNLSGRPWLGPISGALFYAGLALSTWRWRQPRYALSLMWMATGSLPSLITGVSASATRAVAILPVLYLFPAVAVTSLGSFGYASLDPARDGQDKFRVPLLRRSTEALATGKAHSMSKFITIVAALSLIGFGSARTYRDYFHTWANARDVRVAYHTTLFEIARDLDRRESPAGTISVLSSIYPGRYHDPYALDLMVSRRDLSLRWVDGRGAIIFPPSPVHLVLPALAPLDPALGEALAMPHARLIESRHLRPDDLNPGFDVYDWNSAQALEALLSQATCGKGCQLSSPQGEGQALASPADLGHTIAMLGYDLQLPACEGCGPSQSAAPGDEVTIVTYWLILSRPDLELDTVLFTHLLKPEGDPPIAAQQDRLDAPTWNWHPGEFLAQVHRLTISPDLPDGLYPVEVGAYTRRGPSPLEPDPPTTRLALYIEGQPVSDHISLPPLEVKR